MSRMHFETQSDVEPVIRTETILAQAIDLAQPAVHSLMKHW
jgi:hypothetical protein